MTEYLAGRGIYPAVPHRHRSLGAVVRPVEPGLPLPDGVHHRGPGADHRGRISTACPPRSSAIYRQIQAAHIHASPDGPWFFIIARSLAETRQFQLLGITDTAMLRPQVFALQEGEVSIGLICSEKQAIDATLASLARRRRRVSRPWPTCIGTPAAAAHTDGGAFLLTVSPRPLGEGG